MYIINTQSLSEDEIKADLLNFIAGQPDSKRWLDYFDGSHGQTIIELCSGIGALLSYQASANRRETNLLTAKLKSSLYAMAYTLGYPVNRKLCSKVKLTVTNQSSAEIYWQRHIPVGYFKGSPIVLLKDQAIPPGQSVIDCVVGEWEQQRFRITEYEDYLQIAIPLDTDIEYIDNELVEVSLNDVRTKLTRYPEDMESDNLVIKTLINHIVIMFGSQVMGRPAKINDVLTVSYLKIKPRSDVESAVSYTLRDLQIDQKLECSNVELVRREQPEDDLLKLSRVIPGYFASKRRMVTPADHEAIVMSYPGVRDAKFAYGICSVDPLNKHNQSLCQAASGTWNKISTGCCTQGMAYLQYNEQAWLNSEEDLVYKYLEDFQIAGEHIIFRKGEPVLVNLKATVVLKPNVNSEDIKAQIVKAVEAQCYKLGGIFNIAQATREINEIPGVYQCYVQRPYKDRQLAFYGYFKPGNIEISFTSEINLSSDFKDITGGYTPDIS